MGKTASGDVKGQAEERRERRKQGGEQRHRERAHRRDRCLGLGRGLVRRLQASQSEETLVPKKSSRAARYPRLPRRAARPEATQRRRSPAPRCPRTEWHCERRGAARGRGTSGTRLRARKARGNNTIISKIVKKGINNT